jgi:hypothetical protein
MGLLAAAASLVIATPGAASIVTVNANSFAAGTNVSNATAGITLSGVDDNYSTETSGLATTSILTGACLDTTDFVCVPNTSFFTSPAFPDDGSGRIFYSEPGYNTCAANPTAPCPYGNPTQYLFLKISLLNPTNYVQVTSQYANDKATLYAYNSDNQLVGSCGGSGSCTSLLLPSVTGGGSSIAEESLTFLSNSDDISYILVAGVEGTSSVNSVAVNMVSVPEPGPLALLAGGLGAIGLLRLMRSAGGLRGVNADEQTL